MPRRSSRPRCPTRSRRRGRRRRPRRRGRSRRRSCRAAGPGPPAAPRRRAALRRRPPPAPPPARRSTGRPAAAPGSAACPAVPALDRLLHPPLNGTVQHPVRGGATPGDLRRIPGSPEGVLNPPAPGAAEARGRAGGAQRHASFRSVSGSVATIAPLEFPAPSPQQEPSDARRHAARRPTLGRSRARRLAPPRPCAPLARSRSRGAGRSGPATWGRSASGSRSSSA